jgi:hypothetical protein
LPTTCPHVQAEVGRNTINNKMNKNNKTTMIMEIKNCGQIPTFVWQDARKEDGRGDKFSKFPSFKVFA